jgi:hypothetical protein
VRLLLLCREKKERIVTIVVMCINRILEMGGGLGEEKREA